MTFIKKLWLFLRKQYSLLPVGFEYKYIYPTGETCVHKITSVCVTEKEVRYGGEVVSGFSQGSRWGLYENELITDFVRLGYRYMFVKQIVPQDQDEKVIFLPTK